MSVATVLRRREGPDGEAGSGGGGRGRGGWGEEGGGVREVNSCATAAGGDVSKTIHIS